MRAELTGYAGFTPAHWLNSARYCLRNQINLEEALKWVDISMNSERFNGQKSFGALKTKADILVLLKRDADAVAVMEEALTMDASVAELHEYGRTLLARGKSEQALQIFILNRKRHPEDTFTTLVGLARGYTATGNKKEAIKNWEAALRTVPENQQSNRAAFEAELEKLKH